MKQVLILKIFSHVSPFSKNIFFEEFFKEFILMIKKPTSPLSDGKAKPIIAINEIKMHGKT